jgi:hypothetical protein
MTTPKIIGEVPDGVDRHREREKPLWSYNSWLGR